MSRGAATSAQQVFRRHAWAYVAAACALITANWFTGAPWWSFWPLAAWAVVLSVHYLVHKSRTVDESWVAERTANLHSKSYDAHHIDIIAGGHDAKPPQGPAQPPK